MLFTDRSRGAGDFNYLGFIFPEYYAIHPFIKAVLEAQLTELFIVMRLAIRPNSARVGNVEVYETFRVIELDAGHQLNSDTKTLDSLEGSQSQNVPFSQQSLLAIEAQLAIIIPVMDEEQNILDGVLHGVPHDCLIILVSNSEAAKYTAECELLQRFCTNADRSGIAVHQKDENIARAFQATGMPEVVADSNSPQDKLRVRNGKGEAMMIGTVLAKLAGKQFLGFIDADNNVPGAVHEYCKVYAAGLAVAQSDLDPYAMVRIKWNSKPKVEDGKLVFKQSGRCSRVVNEWMNKLLNAITGDEVADDIITTANAGEHAMCLDLAMNLHFATGYAVEPFQLIDRWEHSGLETAVDGLSLDTSGNDQSCIDQALHFESGSDTTTDSNSSPTFTPASSIASSPRITPATNLRGTRVVQIETRNPHIHDISKGEGHIQRMQVQGLSTIFHSSLTPPKLKDELRAYMKKQFPTLVEADGALTKARVYPSMSTTNFDVFSQIAMRHAETLMVVGDVDWKI